MKYLFSFWDKVGKILSEAKHVLVLADFDGTLAPIAGRPELVVLPEEMGKILKNMAKHRGITAAIISGRALSDLKNMVGINGLVYAGNHGLEIEGPGLNFIYPVTAEFKYFSHIIHPMLVKTMSAIRGVVIENKELTLSVHYRQVDDGNVDEVKSTFNRVVGGAEAMGKVKITAGKKVLEVRPVVNWNKGKAVQMIIAEYGKSNKSVPVYLGDDQTDEDAFLELEKHQNGISVFVGNEEVKTAARYYLNSTCEVAQFLTKLLEIKERRS